MKNYISAIALIAFSLLSCAAIDIKSPSGASKDLSNLASPTDINQDLISSQDPWTIKTEDNATADANATGDLTLSTGTKSAGTGDGGDLTLSTGTSAGGSRGLITLDTRRTHIFDSTQAPGPAGFAVITTPRNESGGAGDTQSALYETGRLSGAGSTGQTGDVFFRSGRAETGTTIELRTGDLFLRSGRVDSGATIDAGFTRTGNVTVNSGDINESSGGAGAASGALTIRSGSNAGLGATGSITIRSNNITNGSSAANSGTLTIHTGSNSGSGLSGDLIQFTGDNTGTGDTGGFTWTTGDSSAGGSGGMIFTTGTAATLRGQITMDSATLLVNSGVRPSLVTSDPCGDTTNFPEGTMFYNDTSNYYCFCDGTNDVQMHSPATACF